ncbi:MAG: undecaprenyl-diphosphate phosphatase [Parcubacteria group bacterium]
MQIIHSVILGIVEGFTEFLPISSTAHLMLTSKLLGLEATDFLKSFEIIIQSGAILAVLTLYWRKFLDIQLLKHLAVAFIPAGIIGFSLYQLIKDVLLGDIVFTLWVLGLGGVGLILFEMWQKRRTLRVASVETMDYKTCFMVGVAQSLAVLPGVSRAGATIVGGMLMGVRRETIVEFSFLLAVPTMLAATSLDIIKSPGLFAEGQALVLGVGVVISFITAILSIKFLLSYIRKHTFSAFGVYRVAIAAIGLIIMI